MQTINIHNAQFFAYHGVYSQEQYLGGKFAVDVEIKGDFARSGATDDVADTVNYAEVYEIVKKVMTEKRYNLIERAAQEIVDLVLAGFASVVSVRVAVRKINPPIGGVVDSVEVIFEGSRG